MLKVKAGNILEEEILRGFEDLISEDILKNIREDSRYKYILHELEQLKSKLNSLENNYEFYFQGLHDGMALADRLKECRRLILEYLQAAK